MYVISCEDFYQKIIQVLASKRQRAINLESQWKSSVSGHIGFKSQVSRPEFEEYKLDTGNWSSQVF